MPLGYLEDTGKYEEIHVALSIGGYATRKIFRCNNCHKEYLVRVYIQPGGACPNDICVALRRRSTLNDLGLSEEDLERLKNR